jgi:xanthine dehydrogenase iron-sulfur cluster and FAD-binding subunit A
MAALGHDLTPIDDVRASARYRLTVARNLLLAAFLEHAGEAVRVRRPRAPALV